MKTKIVVFAVLTLAITLTVNEQKAESSINIKSSKELFSLYGDMFKINKTLMKAICKKENPKGDPRLINKNKNGSSDYGLCQVNDRSAKEICKINNPQELLDEETNIYCAYKIFKSKFVYKNSKKIDDNIIRRYNGYDKSESNKNYTKDVVNLMVTMLE